MVNSREKGIRGELEWSKWLREELGCTGARRGQQYCGANGDADVEGGIEGAHPEVKRVEALNLAAAMAKAVEDAAAGGRIPYVAHRRNRTGWLVTIRADDLVEFSEAVCKQKGFEFA